MKIANLVRACFPYVFEHGMIAQTEIDEFLNPGSGSVFGMGNKFPVLKVDDGSGDIGFVTDTEKSYTAFYKSSTCSLSFDGKKYLLSCQFHDWSFGSVAAWLERRGMTEDLIRQAFAAQTSAEDMAADIVECIATFPTDMDFRYALPTETVRFRIADVNKKSSRISYRRSAGEEITDETKTESITASEIKNIAQSLCSCRPVAWNENAESNARTLFSLAALTPNVFIRKDGGSFSLLWNPVREHLPGVYALDGERSQVLKAKMPSADLHLPRQLIVYGAPGTGKSWRIKRDTAGCDVIRTTFHPDSDYSTFVGAYKPAMECERKTYVLEGKEAEVKGEGEKPVFEERIVYKFVPQAFLKAYVRAWRKLADAADAAGADGAPRTSRPTNADAMNCVPTVVLVIEEINRGNCAQIFGDLFQLLDRNDEGFSEYEILADDDLRRYLEEAFGGIADAINCVPPADATERVPTADATERVPTEIAEKVARVFKGEILLLPPNLSIWATMNTSDQSLFPIDSAFKRRWEWKYIPISNAGKNYSIEVGNDRYDWWTFLDKANALVEGFTESEDKKLGYFFCKADGNGVISLEQFVGKVVFYLWNGVFKDTGFDDEVFDDGKGGKLLFKSFFNPDGSPKGEAVKKFLENLGVAKVASDERNAEDASPADEEPAKEGAPA